MKLRFYVLQPSGQAMKGISYNLFAPNVKTLWRERTVALLPYSIHTITYHRYVHSWPPYEIPDGQRAYVYTFAIWNHFYLRNLNQHLFPGSIHRLTIIIADRGKIRWPKTNWWPFQFRGWPFKIVCTLISTNVAFREKLKYASSGSNFDKIYFLNIYIC